MIRQIKSLYRKTLGRIVPPAGTDRKGLDVGTLVRRRVEVTVERESVSVLVLRQPQDSAGQTLVGPSDHKAQTLALPPWPANTDGSPDLKGSSLEK